MSAELPSPPFITCLSFSGGVQSTCLLEMVLRGEIEKPFRFVVIEADPGMERSPTYRIAKEYRRRCREAGIDVIVAPGPNLYHDIINLPSNGAKRIDNPPFWTKDADGKRGKLRQGCTQHYKIAPQRIALRKYLAQKHGVTQGSLRNGFVETWIGFAYDEWHRCSDSDVQYIRLRFPLIEMKMEKAQCTGKFLSWGIPVPRGSVCNACFANGLKLYKDMYDNERDDWEQAVEVDNAVEQWKRLGITREEVFVSSSLVRLRDLPGINFGMDDEDMSEHHCNSGVCFL